MTVLPNENADEELFVYCIVVIAGDMVIMVIVIYNRYSNLDSFKKFIARLHVLIHVCS